MHNAALAGVAAQCTMHAKAAHNAQCTSKAFAGAQQTNAQCTTQASWASHNAQCSWLVPQCCMLQLCCLDLGWELGGGGQGAPSM